MKMIALSVLLLHKCWDSTGMHLEFTSFSSSFTFVPSASFSLISALLFIAVSLKLTVPQLLTLTHTVTQQYYRELSTQKTVTT